MYIRSQIHSVVLSLGHRTCDAWVGGDCGWAVDERVAVCSHKLTLVIHADSRNTYKGQQFEMDSVDQLTIA